MGFVGYAHRQPTGRPVLAPSLPSLRALGSLFVRPALMVRAWLTCRFFRRCAETSSSGTILIHQLRHGAFPQSRSESPQRGSVHFGVLPVAPREDDARQRRSSDCRPPSENSECVWSNHTDYRSICRYWTSPGQRDRYTSTWKIELNAASFSSMSRARRCRITRPSWQCL